MRSKLRVLWLGGLAAVLIAAAAIFWPRPGAQPNVLLITLDTTRADRLGCYGHHAAATPVLDKLAGRGVLFERAYAPAPLTLPSHATMLTGLYPPEHGVHNNGQTALPAALPTLATELQAAGYDTGAFIAAVVLEKKYGLARGFKTYDDDLSQVDSSLSGHHRYRPGGTVVDAALAWLQPRARKPFFCWVHLFDPHYPYLDHADLFGNQFADRPYDAEIAYVDGQVGRLLDALERDGAAERTIVVIVGDHGESLGEHGELSHGMTLYNSALHVPWLVSVPGETKAGTRVSDPVSLVDLAPTLLDCLGRKSLRDISGRSLRAALRGEAISAEPCYAETDEPYHHARWSPPRTLIHGDRKYIRSPRAEYYDFARDPGELQNLIDEQPQAAAELERQLADWENRMRRRLAENVTLTAEERRALESLGYTAGARPHEDGTEPLPDVKEMLPYYNKLNDADAMMDAGRYDLAEPLLREIVAKHENYFLAQGDLGRCLLRTDRTAEAIPYLRRNVELDPGAERVRAMLGAALLLDQQYDAAVAELETTLRLDPELVEARYNLGMALEKLGRRDEAVEQYRTCLDQVPHLLPARQRLEALEAISLENSR